MSSILSLFEVVDCVKLLVIRKLFTCVLPTDLIFSTGAVEERIVVVVVVVVVTGTGELLCRHWQQHCMKTRL